MRINIKKKYINCFFPVKLNSFLNSLTFNKVKKIFIFKLPYIIRLIFSKNIKKISVVIKNFNFFIRTQTLNSLLNFINLDILKKIFYIFFFFSISFLFLTFAYPLNQRFKKILPDYNSIQDVILLFSNFKEAESISNYTDIVSQKNIFDFSSPIIMQDAVINIPDSNILRNFKLVGIIADRNIQAVIEDTQKQTTNYVEAGQFIGEIRVVDIQQGKVILSHKGQLYELYL